MSNDTLTLDLSGIDRELLKGAALHLTEAYRHPFIQAIGHLCLAELKQRIGIEHAEPHVLNLRKLDIRNLFAVDAQLGDLIGETENNHPALASLFRSVKGSVEDQLRRRSVKD